MVYRLRLLGGASIEGARGPLSGPVAQRRCLALLALLAATPFGRASRDKLIGYLWPESPPRHARDHLIDATYSIRKALGHAAILCAGGELRLNTVVVESDLDAFEGAMARRALDRAVSLYQGPFLDGFFYRDSLEFEHWVDGVRRRLAHCYAHSLETLAMECEARKDAHGAVDWWGRLVAHDPYSTHATLHLLQALNNLGDRGDALREAGTHALFLREELGLDPGPEIAAFVDHLRAPDSASQSKLEVPDKLRRPVPADG